MLGVCGMLSRMIKRGVGWSRRPPMHVGSRDAGLAAASSESDVHRHAGYARIRRWCGSEDVCSVGLRDGRARPKLASGPPSSSRASRLGVFVVIRHCHSFDISSVSYTHTGVALRGINTLTTSPDFNDAENTHNREITQSQIHYISILNGRRHSLAFHLCRRTRFAVLARERGRDHASLAAHL